MVYLVGMTYMRVAGAHIQWIIMCGLNTGTMWRLCVFLLEALLFKYGDNVAYENFAKALFI